MNTPLHGHTTAGTAHHEPGTTAPVTATVVAPRRRPEPPAWRQAFNQVEVFVGRPLESVTNSPEAAAILIVTDRLARGVFQQIDALASWGIHQLHLPSQRDVRMLQRQLSAIQRQLSDVHAELYDLRGRDDRPGR
ncbi:hypothetical protein AB0H49_20520 [Nocardia sp. NPDC050713]|uniref:hypothetical protein n=1 Tax=Nocardia sp. NPDC050713 TaxID=3154511 RepID=UPI0033F38141